LVNVFRDSHKDSINNGQIFLIFKDKLIVFLNDLDYI